MEFKEQNDKLREYYKQDFTPVNRLLKRIREALINRTSLNTSGLNLKGLIDFDPAISLTYISIFQPGLDVVRYGSRRGDLGKTLNRDLEKIRENKNFDKLNLSDNENCRIMIEYICERKQTELNKIQQFHFNENRFEIGINGLELKLDGISYYYMPTDAIVLSHMGLKSALENVVKKSKIGKMTNRISERMKILEASDYELYLIKSRAFVSCKDKCVPLYRGNILYNEFNYDTVMEQFIKSADWLVKNIQKDGRFIYYYDCAADNYKDHEHPARTPDNLYYNDLRHCGGIITLIRAYTQTGEDKYIECAKNAMDFITQNTKEQSVDGERAYYVFYNSKAKLGGTGMALIAAMQYRIATGKPDYDAFIEGYARHLLSRLTMDGEFLGYYIHPDYNNGKPLLNLNEKQRKETFSFYYPGEALLGLALVKNKYDKNEKLVDTITEKCAKALDWIVEERPKIYGDLFTELPSDAWLMQAIEEFAEDADYVKTSHLKFVFDDANTMIQKMYKENDSPYIDYDGGYYYRYGDHFYPDGARSEGLIAAYYLAKKIGKDALAEDILNACKKAAKCQFHLFNCEQSNFSHKNPEKSLNSIRFKATRQWVRVDSIQHVACFFIRLFWAENRRLNLKRGE